MKAGAHDYLLKENLTRLVPTIEREMRDARVRIEHRQAFETIQYLAFYDPLTGQPNRTLFLNQLQQAIETQHQDPNECFAILLVNVDRYRTIKYSLGHLVGEQLLAAIADRLRLCLSDKDLLARVGGDEFAILLRSLPVNDPIFQQGIVATQSVPTQSRVGQLYNHIHHVFELPFHLEGAVIFSKCSVGIVLSTLRYTQAEDFLRAADTARYQASREGQHRVTVFDATMQTSALNRLELETDLQRAIQHYQFKNEGVFDSDLDDNHLFVNYQPIVSLLDNRLISFEALARWHHPNQGDISPNIFISIAEETGLILSLGQWVLEQACQQIHHWKACYPQLPVPCVSVNLSAKQLAQTGLVEQIDHLLDSYGLDGRCLKVEVTESVLMENAAIACALLEQLKEREIQICIDDFGTGYSSLSYLTTLSIDILKIDRSFVSEIGGSPKQLNIVKTIMTLAQRLNLKVIAEGIETIEQANILRSLGCHYGQGFWFSEALPLDEIDLPLMVEPILKIKQ